MIAKIAILCLVSGVLAEDPYVGANLGQGGYRGPGLGGAGPYGETNYPAQPFSFGYDTVDEYGNRQFHKEEADANNARTGSYGYTDANGIYRRVNYVADANGFRATIETNEPGTQSGASADAVFNANPVVVAPGAAKTPVAYDAAAYAKPAGLGYDQPPGYQKAGYDQAGPGAVGFGKPLFRPTTRGFRG
ncbi:putative cuticle protein [Ixodes scapularis]